MRRRVRIGFVALLGALACPAAWADDHPMLDYFSISLGGFANSTSASLRADGGARGSGSRLDFSRDLGQDGTRALPYLDVTWRPFDRHEFEFSYYHDTHDTSRTLDRTIEFNDQTLMLGARLDSRFTLDAASAGYRYWAWIGDQGAFGVSAGLQAYRFTLKLSGEAVASSSAGSAGVSSSRTAHVSSDLPDPSIGVSYRYQMASWARLVADAGAFKANISNVDAKLYNARLGVEFYPLDHVGIVTQYAFNKINADVTKSSFYGNADFRFKGFQLLIKARF